MRKEQTRALLVTIAIATILLTSILFINNNLFEKLFAQNNKSSSSSNNTGIGKGAAPSPQGNLISILSQQISTQRPHSMNSSVGKGEPTIKPTPAPTSSDPANILDSLMNPKALLGPTIDLIRNSTAKSGNNETVAPVRNMTIFFVRNPGILLLSHQIIPPKDFIPVYDALPYKIMSGRVFAKLPCDSNSKTSLQILEGQLLYLKPAQLKLIAGLSRPGYMCMYYSDLISPNNSTVITTNTISKPKVGNLAISGAVVGMREGNLTISYIELFNPSDYRVLLPGSASLSISVNQIMPLEGLHANDSIRLNQTAPPKVNQTAPPKVNQTSIQNSPLTRTGISPSIAFVYNAWNPYLKQKTYLPIAPLVNETILSNAQCSIHAIWQSSKEEQSDLTELKEYSIVTNNDHGNPPPLHLFVCGGAPIP